MPHDNDERRKYRRFDRRIPCEFRIAGQPYRSFITNISAGGFFILTSSRAEDGTEILVTLELDPGTPIVITGVIARKHPIHRSIAAVSKAGMGILIESAPEAFYQFVMELERSD